jgi:hypothetical protein
LPNGILRNPQHEFVVGSLIPMNRLPIIECLTPKLKSAPSKGSRKATQGNERLR